MRKNIKLLVFMVVLAMHSIPTWSATNSAVALNYIPTGRLGNNPKPTKAPAHFSIPLSVVLDDENQQLLVTALAEGEFTYSICSETGDLITEGILNCYYNDSHTMNIGLYNCGVYYLYVTYNGHVFGGTFEIYE